MKKLIPTFVVALLFADPRMVCGTPSSQWKQDFTVSGVAGNVFDSLQIDFINESGLEGDTRFLTDVEFKNVSGQTVGQAHTIWGWGPGIDDPPFNSATAPGVPGAPLDVVAGGNPVVYTLFWTVAGTPANNIPAIRPTPADPNPLFFHSYAFGPAGAARAIAPLGDPVRVIPEPATIGLALSGFIVVGLARWCRKRLGRTGSVMVL